MFEPITPDNTIFVQLCFEGTDPYSQAGGLGTRVVNMGEALAEQGFETHLFFIGDPHMPAEETKCNGRYVWHRWSQWISKHHPAGVYDGEEGKLTDYSGSVPVHVYDRIARPAAAAGKRLVVIAEDWHTVDALCNLSDRLHEHGIRMDATLMWNANNTMGFHRINWNRLRYVATITAVSRFMKHTMWPVGVDAISIPNGIPRRMLKKPDPKDVRKLQKVFKDRGADLALLKIGRFDPAKRWMMATEAVALLKRGGVRPLFMVRGGIEPHGAEVLERAAQLGLNVHDIVLPGRPTVDECIDAVRTAPAHADVLHLRFFLPEEFVRLLYRCCHAVFANSGFEPFGLVGLEVMGAGGIAFTGSTGEDYVMPFVNAVSCESSDPREMVAYLRWLNQNPDAVTAIKREAARTAAHFTWDNAINNLLRRIEFIATQE
jgi:glycosyltransferase involved in cell wall biosynthesis